MITLTTFKTVPPMVQGLVRDLRVRWALEEIGTPYRVDLLEPGQNATPAYRARQPFGQVPVIDDDGLTLFESGAIVLHIAAKSEALMPNDEAGRLHVTGWVIAGLNSVEQHVQNLTSIDLFSANEEWAKLRRPEVEALAKRRLDELADSLGDKDYLAGRFSAADLIMATVLRLLRHTDLVTAHPVLGPYLARCEARPAFQRALRAQMDVFRQNAA